MKSFRVRSVMVLLACTILSTGYAFADNRGRERGDHERRAEIRRELRERERKERWERARERRELARRHERERLERERRARWERERRMNDHRPPGWDRGRKTGWGDRDVPPGQAKKIGYERNHFGWRDPAYRPDWRRPDGPRVHQLSMHRR